MGNDRQIDPDKAKEAAAEIENPMPTQIKNLREAWASLTGKERIDEKREQAAKTRKKPYGY